MNNFKLYFKQLFKDMFLLFANLFILLFIGLGVYYLSEGVTALGIGVLIFYSAILVLIYYKTVKRIKELK